MAQQQQQRRGRTFVTAAVIFHTHTQPGVQLHASVCVCVPTKRQSDAQVHCCGSFFLVLSTRCPQLFGPHIYKYVYMYIQLHISPDSSLRVWRVKKWSALFFILLSRQLTHKRDLTQPHTFFNKFIGRKKWYLIVCLELFSALEEIKGNCGKEYIERAFSKFRWKTY